MTDTDAATDAEPALAGPFGIDTPDYSDRDREMFCLGYEFHSAMALIRYPSRSGSVLVHTSNVPRIRAACEADGAACRADPTFDPTWTMFRVRPRDDEG